MPGMQARCQRPEWLPDAQPSQSGRPVPDRCDQFLIGKSWRKSSSWPGLRWRFLC